MIKRTKLEILKDILKIIQENHGRMKPTPLLRKSNLSSKRFQGYFEEMLKKGFVKEAEEKGNKFVVIQEKGARFLERYKTIVSFINEFEL